MKKYEPFYPFFPRFGLPQINWKNAYKTVGGLAATQAVEAPSTPTQYRGANFVCGIESVLSGLLEGIKRAIIGQ
jgi:hypothetical protein